VREDGSKRIKKEMIMTLWSMNDAEYKEGGREGK
jgi:hypothetical protein